MKKILIIGAGFLQSYVIKKAKEMGYETYAIDGNPNADGFQYADHYATINIVDESACLAYAKENQIDGVLTAATEYGVLSSSYVAQEMNLPGLNYSLAKMVKNKYLVRKCFIDNFVDDIREQVYKVDADTDISILSNKLIYPVMVKPCDGSGSRGANRVNCSDELNSACLLARNSSITHSALIEPFVDGNEYGAECIVTNDEIHIMAIMKKQMTKPPYYAELGHTIPCGLPKELENKAKECVKKAIKALGINLGAVNVDMLVNDEGEIHIVDIGARMGGNLIGSHIIPYGTGYEYMDNLIRLAVGDEVNFKPKDISCVSTRLLALNPGVVKKLPDFEMLKKEYDVQIEHHLHIGDIITEYRTNLDGCGYVVARRSNPDLANTIAEQVKDIINETIERG